MRKVMISPSILDADFADIRSAIQALDRAKADFIHFDVMDGNFVPVITFGPKIMKPLRPLTKTLFDTHLMVLNPEKYIDSFIDAGADLITVHYEAVKDPDTVIKQIKNRGKKAGVSIKPGTPADVLDKYLAGLDLVLVMSVEPGYGGQKFMEPMLDKVKHYRQLIDRNKYTCLLEIDGGVNLQTLPLACAAGIDVFVAGNAVFGGGKPEEAIRNLMKVAEECR
jgi:ribulose-phosphate 3-epimerase